MNNEKSMNQIVLYLVLIIITSTFVKSKLKSWECFQEFDIFFTLIYKSVISIFQFKNYGDIL